MSDQQFSVERRHGVSERRIDVKSLRIGKGRENVPIDIYEHELAALLDAVEAAQAFEQSMRSGGAIRGYGRLCETLARFDFGSETSR